MVEVIVTNTFSKNVKKISKKDKLLHKDLQYLYNLLQENPKSGIFLGNNAYKIRLKNSSNNKGKSGGYRVISYLYKDDVIGLLTIYLKSEKENIFEDEIDSLIVELAKNFDEGL